MEPQNAEGANTLERFLKVTEPYGLTSAFGTDELGMGFIGRSIPVYGAAKSFKQLNAVDEAMQAYQQDKADDQQVRLLQNYFDQLARSKTFGGKVGDITASTVSFLGDFVAGNEIGRGALKIAGATGKGALAASVAAKMDEAGILGGVGKTLVAGAAGQASMDLAGAIVGQAGPTLARAKREQVARAFIAHNEENKLVVKALENAPTVAQLIPKAFMNGVIERGSEMAGSFLFKLPVEGRLAAFSHYLTNKVAQAKGAAYAQKILNTTGMNGIVEEIGEEVYGALLNDLAAAVSNGQLADPGQLRELTEFENAAVMVIGMGVTMVGMQAAAGAAGRIAAGKGEGAKPEAQPAPAGAPQRPSRAASVEAPQAAQEAAGAIQAQTDQTVAQAPEAAAAPSVGQGEAARPASAGTAFFTPDPNMPALGLDPSAEDAAGPMRAQAAGPDQYRGTIPGAVITGGPQTAPAGSNLDYLGRGLFGTLEGPGKGKYSIDDVMKLMEETLTAFDQKIQFKYGRTARGTGKRTLGTWHGGESVLRVRQAGSLSIAAHELGHAFETFLVGNKQLWKKGTTQVPPDVLNEVLRLGYGQAKVQGFFQKNQQRHGKEGFAEFIAGYLLNNPHLNSPKTVEWFEKLAPPELLKKIRKMQKVFRAYAFDGAVGQGLASIGEPTIAKRALALATRQVARNRFKRAFSRKIWEELESFIEITNEANKRKQALGRGPLLKSEDVGKMAQVYRGRHASVVNHWLHNEMTNLYGHHVGPALMAIKPLIKGMGKKFDVYLLARRTQAEEAAAKIGRRAPRELALSPEIANAVVEELRKQFPRVEEAAQMVYRWTEQGNHYIAQCSPILAEHIATVEEGDVGNYIPEKRILDGIRTASSKVTSSDMQRGTVTKRLVGSFRRVKDPLASLMAQMEDRVRRAHERALAEAAIALGEQYGLGQFVERVDVDRYIAANPKIGDIIGRMMSALGIRNDPLSSEELRKEVSDAIIDALANGKLEMLQRRYPSANWADINIEEIWEQAVMFFAPSWNPKASDDPVMPIIMNRLDGTKELRYYSLDADLYKALTGLDMPRINNWLYHMVIAVPKRIATMGITGLSYTFGLLFNPTRDYQSLLFNTRSNANVAQIFFQWVQSQAVALADAIRAEVLGVPFEKMSEQYKAYHRLFLGMHTRLGADLREAKKQVAKIHGHNFTTITGVKDFLGWLVDKYQNIIQFPERGTRMAEVVLIAKEMGIRLEDIGVSLNHYDATHLSFVGSRAGVDFNAGGSVSRLINTMVPFFNVQFQGPRATWEAIKQRPVRALMRAAGTMVLPTLALWWINKDEEWYQALSTEEKARYWHISVGDRNVMRIPRAFEIGAMTCAPAELLADAFYREDPQGAQEFFGTLFKTGDQLMGEVAAATPLGMVPNPLAAFQKGKSFSDSFEQASLRWMPVIPGLYLENKANKRFYWGTPIVTRANERKWAPDQYTDFTSRAAIRIGRATGTSPQKIDHAVNYLFGSTGRSAMGVFGQGDTDINFERDISDNAFLGRLFKTGGKFAYSDNARKVYDQYEEADKDFASGRELSPAQKDKRLLLQRTTKLMTALAYVRARTESADERYKLNREIDRYARQTLDQVNRLSKGARGPNDRADIAGRVRAASEAIQKRLREAEDLKAAVIARMQKRRSGEAATTR